MSTIELVCRVVVVGGALAFATAFVLAPRESRRAKAERRVLDFLSHGDWVFGADIIRRCQLGRGAGLLAARRHGREWANRVEA